MKAIVIETEKCTGCHQCVLTCAFVKAGHFVPDDAAVRIAQWEERCLSVPVICRLCADAPCVSACPASALSRSPATGVIVVDRESCSGCDLCREGCPYGAIHLAPDGYPVVCDLCEGAPACVSVCFPGALQFVDDAVGDNGALATIGGLVKQRLEGRTVPCPSKAL
jgi:carbon-monoxide dehydrogenase iron sulfur subunit